MHGVVLPQELDFAFVFAKLDQFLLGTYVHDPLTPGNKATQVLKSGDLAVARVVFPNSTTLKVIFLPYLKVSPPLPKT